MPRKTFVAGEVLAAADVNTYLMDQAVMTFAGTAARGSAIASPSAGMVSYLEDEDTLQVYGGTAVGWADYRRAPVSNNAIINGDFGVWQRGTSFTGLTADAYTADRWNYSDSGATVSITREAFTPADLTAIGYGDAEYFLRYNITTGDANNALQQRIEDVRTFAGQQVTLSFWAKADATYTELNPYFVRNYGSGGSSAEAVGNGLYSPTLTTSWQRFSFTFDLPSVSGKTIGASSYLQVNLMNTTTGTPTIDFWGVQLEAGPVATPFRLAGGGSKAAELALCQRYYEVIVSGDAKAIGLGTLYTTSDMRGFINFLEKRVEPTLEQVSGTDYYAFARSGSLDPLDGFSAINPTNKSLFLRNNTNVAGATAGDAGNLRTNNTNAFIALDAEL